MAWKSLLDIIYPVGSIYFSVSSTSPSSIIGGTWTAIPAGTFLCGAGSGYSALSTGGQAAVTLTIAEMPEHNHTYDGLARYTITGNGMAAVGYNIQNYDDIVSHGFYKNSSVGGGDSHENRPPYIAVYIWRRTA